MANEQGAVESGAEISTIILSHEPSIRLWNGASFPLTAAEDD